MFKNIYFRLGLISAIFTLALLVTLPRIPVQVDNRLLSLDSYIGGYYFTVFDKYIIDFRELKKGLDLSGGIRIVLNADMSGVDDVDKQKALESAKEVISRRVNLLGVSEPYIATIQNGDDYRILVEIPGIDDVAQAVKLIGQTSQLKFKELAPDKEFTDETYAEYYQDPTAWVETGLTGADLKGADVVFDDQTSFESGNSPKIQLRFSNEGRDKFVQIAQNNLNKPIALFLDEDQFPISAPIVSPDLAEGLVNDPVISGNFDVQTANALSLNIRAGALPIPVKVLQQQTIGATLGNESVQRSFFAGAVGLVLVMVFMIFMYGRLGLLADFALILYTIVTLAIFKIVPVVLTLPGIAGFILSVGMAADANILIFERVKEEIIWGKPRNLAIRLGFERAWTSIRDSNISSLITCAVLFNFGTGPVKGFAVTLAIGILVSLFSSIFVVRTIIQVFNIGMNDKGEERKTKLSLPKLRRIKSANN